MIILYDQYMIDDLLNCCSSLSTNSLRTICGIDVTFELTDGYLTVTVYKNPKLLHKNNPDKSPVLIGYDSSIHSKVHVKDQEKS